MKRSVDVKIMGQSFTVTSDEGEEHLHKVAELVDAKMREASGATKSASTMSVAILAALNIASDYQKLVDEQDALEHSLDALSSRVQERLKDPPSD